MRKFIEQAKAKQVMAKKAEQTVKNRQAGTSLLEVLIGLLLVALLLSGLWGLLYTAGQAWRLGVSKLELQQTARYALDIMVRDLRYGENFILEDETHLDYIGFCNASFGFGDCNVSRRTLGDQHP